MPPIGILLDEAIAPPPVAPTAPPPNVGAILTGFVNAPVVAPTAPPPNVGAILTGIVNPPQVAPTETAPNVGAILTGIVNPPDLTPNVGAILTSIVNPPDENVPVSHDQTPSDAPDGDFPDLEGLDFFSNPPLSGAAFVQYVRRGCQSRNLDDLAVFANAMGEGLGGGMGDNGTSFGPWNMHQQGALPKKYWSYPSFSPLVQVWTWSSGGIDYALDQMVKAGASGLRGHNAVHRIVEGFERPANMAAQEVIRDDYYDALAKMGDPYSFLAGRAAGASVDVQSTPAPVVTTNKSPVGAVGFWRTLMDVFWKEVPKTRAKVLAQGDNMKEVFK